MKTIAFNSNTWLIAQSDFTNPFLTIIKFIFADDKPNRNNQAIPQEEFASLAQSAIGMPIKIRFLGKGIGSHTGSVPVGHIRDMVEETDTEGVHRLVAEGVLYNEEYPEVIDFLKESFAAGEAPGLSWELAYKESIIEKGIEWLKGVIAKATTFVKHPAYGTRTALLALASDTNLSEEDIEKELVGMAHDIEGQKQGGKNNVELEQALERIKELEAQIASKEAALAEANTAVSTAQASVEELKTLNGELVSKVSSFEKALIVESRTKKISDVGVQIPAEGEELTKKQEVWAAMSEELFETYVSDLAAAVKVVPEKRASASVLQLPKISVDTSTNNGAVSAESLRNRMRSLGKNEATAD
jgi:uncharacterized coiled-coil protein SlyX